MSTQIKIFGHIDNIKRNKNIKHKMGSLITLCSGKIGALKFMVEKKKLIFKQKERLETC